MIPGNAIRIRCSWFVGSTTVLHTCVKVCQKAGSAVCRSCSRLNCPSLAGNSVTIKVHRTVCPTKTVPVASACPSYPSRSPTEYPHETSPEMRPSICSVVQIGFMPTDQLHILGNYNVTLNEVCALFNSSPVSCNSVLRQRARSTTMGYNQRFPLLQWLPGLCIMLQCVLH